MFFQPTPPFLIAPADPRSWGPWRLDVHNTELVCVDGPTTLVIPLATCTTAAAVIDWCMHLVARGWAEQPTVICGLVVALDDILDLQASVCTDARTGHPGATLSASDITARVDGFAAGPNGVRHMARDLGVESRSR